MKKIVAILLAVLMMIPAFALGENVVKIGVFEPASGDSASGGKKEMLGMQFSPPSRSAGKPTPSSSSMPITVLPPTRRLPLRSSWSARA